MIKLSDLKAARAKMEPGPYTHEPCESPAGSVNIQGSRCTCDKSEEMCPQHEYIAEWVPLDTAIGIEATHTAADILIEVATAALAWRESEQQRGEALRVMNDVKSSSAAYSEASLCLPRLERTCKGALSRLTEILSKVQL